MIESFILEALQKSAIAARDASSVPSMPIKPMGRSLDAIPPDGRYLELVNIPNNRQGDYIDDSRVYQGNFRIILHWFPDDEGAYPPMRYLEEIAANYTVEKSLWFTGGRVQIYGKPDASGPIETGAELLFPLTLPYRCFAAS